MSNAFRGALWPAATLRFAGLATGALLFEWLLCKGAHLLRWGWNDPRTANSDVFLYFEWLTGIVAGRSPYIDFLVPYPPVALLVTLLPGVFARSFNAYLIAYSLLMFAAAAALFALTESYARLLHKDVKQTLGWLTAFLVPLSGLILWRFDVLVAVTTMGALLLLARARPGAAGSVAALGALVKLVPALVLAVPLLRLHREARPALRSVFFFLLTVATVCAAWFAYAGPSLYISFKIHSQRGLECGSLSAGFLLLLGQFFPQSARLITTNPCICVEVDHAWAPSLAAAALPLQVIVLSLAAIWIFLQRQRNDARDLSLLFFLYILAGKVLSPQYLIWVAPFVAFLPRLRWPFLVACILTTAVYPIGFELLLKQVTWPIVALNVRNAILIYCVWLIVSPTRTQVD
jgi:hypothetical protein